MKHHAHYILPLLAVILVGSMPLVAFAQAPAPPAPPRTLWRFLGIPQGYQRVHSQVFNRTGNHPRLERRPPLRPIADPLNLESPIPAIKAAAEIKTQEDLAPQKIKAIKYLASIGCGCYDKDGLITNALLAAMDDCTEDVRLAAVEAVAESAANKNCGYCHTNCCCGEKIVEQLANIAYERDEAGCWLEPSERVRAAAIQALAACCPGRGPAYVEGEIIFEGDEVIETPEDIEIPENTTPPPPPPTSDTPPPPPPAATLQTPTEDATVQRQSSRRGYQTQLVSSNVEVSSSKPEVAAQVTEKRYGEFFQTGGVKQAAPSRPVTVLKTSAVEPESRILEPIRGVIEHIDMNRGIVHLHLENTQVLPARTVVKVYHDYATGPAVAGQLMVTHSDAGRAHATVVGTTSISKFSRGDTILGVK